MLLKKRQELIKRMSPRLREIRIHRRLTQKALGEAAGVSGAQIGHYEAGQGEPSLTQAILIMERLGVWTIDLLMPAGSRLPPCRKRRKVEEYVSSFYWPDPLEELLRLAEDISKEVNHNGHVMATNDWVAATKERLGIEVPPPAERAARRKRMIARIKQHAQRTQ